MRKPSSIVLPGASPVAELRAVVATPSKNEAKSLTAFFHALSAQENARGLPLPRGAFTVVLLINNSDDDSAALARCLAREAQFEIDIIETLLPAEYSHAGGARRAVMDLAAARLIGASHGVILTTDADSRVAPNWIQSNLDAFAGGADVVLGTIELDEDGALLPERLHARGDLEATYERVLAEVSARLDPTDHNPWPHHATISGASLAVTRDMYFRAGRLPRVPLGEDKAFVAALRRCDAKIRFSPDVHVITSGRTLGRAPGGVADTLRLRSNDPDAICDEMLEPLVVAFRRALWRGRLRRRGALGTPRWQAALRVSDKSASEAYAAKTFGEAWETIEATSPMLVRRPLTPGALSRQIELGERLLRKLRGLAPFENIESIFRLSNGLDDFSDALHVRDEDVGGLVAG